MVPQLPEYYEVDAFSEFSLGVWDFDSTGNKTILTGSDPLSLASCAGAGIWKVQILCSH